MFDLFVILTGTAIPFILTSLNVTNTWLASVTIASVLTWPGYVVTLWLWPRPGQLGSAQRLALTPMFSIVVVVIVTLFAWFVLRYTAPLLIHALTFGGITLATLLTRTWRAGSRRELAAVFGAFVAISGLVALTAAVPPQGLSAILFPGGPSPHDHLPGALTEFYVAEPTAQAERPLREVTAGQPSAVKIGIANREGVTVRYTVVVKSGDEVIGLSHIISLADSAVWEQPVGFTLPAAGDNQKVVFILEREGHASPYRTLQLRLNVKAPGGAP